MSVTSRVWAMAKKKGNPDFGTKYRFQQKGESTFDSQLKARVYSDTKDKFSQLAEEKGVTVPDVVREALYKYLEDHDKITA